MECSKLEKHVKQTARTGWRTLVVLHSRSLHDAISILAGITGGDCLLVAPKDLRGAGCSMEKSPMDVDEYLGTEHGAAIVASPGLLRPNIVASAGETVRAGGFLALVVPPRREWQPGPPGGAGYYREYLERSIPTAGSHLWLDLDGCSVYSEKRYTAEPAPGRDPSRFRSRKGVPRRLLAQARTWSQAEALEAGARWLRGRDRSLLVWGDRGRGKSYVSGLILALAVYWHSIGRAEVVAPSLVQAQQVFRGLVRGLEALGIAGRPGVRVVESRGNIVRVTGPWFRVSYEEPGKSRGAPLIVLDEAAALGVARVRRLSWRSGKVLISTTIHGYEGSGRTLATMIERIAPRPYRMVVLEEPVRYLPGDPLEEWLYRVFLLDVDPEGPQELAGEPRYEPLSPERLARDPLLLRRTYAVLMLAHYRTQPDDIMVILDSPGRWVHTLTLNGHPIAVALLVDEGMEGADLASSRLRLVVPEAEPPRSVRVQRIAVLPWLQRRGLGSLLLSRVEEWASSMGFEAVLTIFSRGDVAGFWARNGYTFYYVSPRYNRVTGEKNLAAGKGLTPSARQVLEEAGGRLRTRLLWTLPSIYRDLAAENLVDIIEATRPPRDPSHPNLPNHMLGRLEACREGRLDPEQAWDSIVAASVCIVERMGLAWIGDRRLRVFYAARVLQGKPVDEAAGIAGLSLEEAVAAQGDLCRMIGEAFEAWCSSQ